MKKIIFTLFFISSLFGWVGEITALKGGAVIIRDNNTTNAFVHMKLEEKDIIKTQQNSKMQIIFKDNTIITIGKNSEVKVSDYLFDGENSQAKFKLKYGIMKTLTGKIGKLAPKRFKVMTKNASIGIRGTYFVVESYKDIIKLGMIKGVTEFTNLDNMKNYVVKAGEQLIFNVDNPKDVIIKDGYLEPKTTKIKPLSKTIKEVQDEVDDTENDAVTENKDVTTTQNSKSTGIYDGFFRGLIDKFFK